MFQIQSVFTTRPHRPCTTTVPCPGSPPGSGPSPEAIPGNRPQTSWTTSSGWGSGPHPCPGPQTLPCPSPRKYSSWRHRAGRVRGALRWVFFWKSSGLLWRFPTIFNRNFGARIWWKVRIRLGNLQQPWESVVSYGSPWTGGRLSVFGLQPLGSLGATVTTPRPFGPPHVQVLAASIQSVI